MNKNLTNEELEQQVRELKEALRVAQEENEQSKVNQQKHALDLANASRLFESIVEHSTVPMVVASVEGNIMAFNKVCMEQLGIDDVKIGMPISYFKDHWQCYDRDGNSLTIDELPLLQSLKGLVTKNKEICFQRKDGTKRWQITSSNPIYNIEGEIIAGFVIFPDITQRVIAETLLVESEEKYRKIFDNANISIWDEDFSQLIDSVEKIKKAGITDLKKHLDDNPGLDFELARQIRIHHVNDATLKLFDVPCRESFFDQIPQFFGENTINVFRESLFAIWNNEPYFRSEANYFTAKGHEINAIISYIIPENRNGFKSIPVTLLDITEFKYQQDRLNAIVSSLPDITFVFNEDGLYQEVHLSNDLPFYDEVMSAKGKYIKDVLTKEQAVFFMKNIRKTLETGENQVIQYELDLPRGLRWFEGRISPMQHTIKNKKSVVWLAIDITDHKKVEQQFRQAQKMEAVGILTGGIAHEFNNLLSPILGYTELLLTKKTEQDRDYNSLNQIYLASNRGKILVQQLLAYGRQSMSQKETIYLPKLLDEVLKFLVNSLPVNIRIHKDIQSELPMIDGMHNEIHQIILNLCMNASHAMCDGGDLYFSIKITKPSKYIENKLDKAEQQYICLSVRDTGTGMDQFVLERIFDPFFTTKEIGQGSGLGLSVVEGILEQHNGAVEVQSRIGEGSTFSLYFPVSEREIIRIKEEPTPLSKGTEHILLVDDDAQVIDISKNMLEMLDYKVTSLTSSEQALRLFTEDAAQFDLVIVDYGMPVLNGKQLAKGIKKVRPDIPIILCTGYGDLIAKENITQWGMDDVLLKPFAFKELSAIVRKVLI